MNIVGLDIGTTTIGGVLVDAVKMALLGSKTLPNNASLRTPHSWENYQDPEVIWDICQELLNYFTGLCPKIDAIGITGQMHGMLYVDKTGKSVGKLATWQDDRGNQIYKSGTTYCKFLTSATGYPMATGYGLTTHFYNIKNGLVPENAATFCTIADYIAMCLCIRVKPLIHSSNAASFGVYDFNTGGFDHAALEKASIQLQHLPEISPVEKIIGCTENDIPVCIPIGDNQASFLGSVDQRSNLLVNIGTGSQISLKVNQFIQDSSLTHRPYVGGSYLLVGSGLCGGSAYQLLRDLFREIVELYGIPPMDDLYVKMGRAAEEVYGVEHQLEIDTRFRGTRVDPTIRGSIHCISADNFKPGFLAAGILRGICDEMRSFFKQMPEALRYADHLVGSGNALRKNITLRKILSDTFEKKVLIPQFAEEASLGAAILAASIVDKDRSIEDFQTLIKY